RLAAERGDVGSQQFRNGDALFLRGGQRARKDRLADERQWRALLERLDHGPLPGALLTRSVQDGIQNRLAALVYVAEDVSSDLEEVAVALTAVPLINHVAHLRIDHLQHVLHHTVGFAD